ncbi:hypothetical protein HBH94_038040 [Parastagonospora nodorum]|nr:hypothetical protein HBH94_038040 [Parastagonospora nodorum]
MNSMVFKSSPNLRNELPSNPTLVNIRDAADTSVTALPMPATALEDQVVERKMGWWSRMPAYYQPFPSPSPSPSPAPPPSPRD